MEKESNKKDIHEGIIDRVIKGLETCAGTNNSGDDDTDDCVLDCPYKGSLCIDRLMYDALAMLKEQEPVPPIKQYDGNPKNWASCWYVCGNCERPIDCYDKFCRSCGRMVKWEC